MLTSLLACIAAAGAGSIAPPTPIINYGGVTADDSNAASYSLAGVPIGTAHANRRVILCIQWRGAANALTSVEIGGVTAEFAQNVNAGSNQTNAIAWADVPTGVTATVDIDLAGSVSGIIVQSFWSHTVDLVPLQVSGDSQSTTTSFTWDHWPAVAGGFQLVSTAALGTSGQGEMSVTYDGDALTKYGESNRESTAWGAAHLIANVLDEIKAMFVSSVSSGSKCWMGSAWGIQPADVLYPLGVASTTSTGSSVNLVTTGFGKPHANRLIIVALAWARTTGTSTLDSATIGGVAATIVAQSTGSSLSTAIIYANVPAGEAGDINVTMSSLTHFRMCRVFRAVPASATPVDSVTLSASSATSAVGADLEVKAGGFAVVAGAFGDDDVIGCTWEGAEAVEQQMDWIAASNRRLAAWSFETLADETAHDVTLTIASATNIRGVAASWL